MDIKELIVASARQILEGVKEAQQTLKDETSIGLPTRLEIEIGITSSYEMANYDDIRIANVIFSVPLYTEATSLSPASAALGEPGRKTSTRPTKRTAQ